MLHFRRPTTAPPLIFFLGLATSINYSLAYNSKSAVVSGRSLKGIKERPDGGNVTFDCSPSGTCVAISRAEKSDEKYRCDETGYRIRLKCLPAGSDPKDAINIKTKKMRSTLEDADLGVDQRISSRIQSRLQDDSSKSGGSSGYTTYRSCMYTCSNLALSSGSFILFRRKHTGRRWVVYQCGSQPILGFEFSTMTVHRGDQLSDTSFVGYSHHTQDAHCCAHCPGFEFCIIIKYM